MDVTTFFLILSVSVLFNNVFHSKFGFYLILLILLIVVGLIGGAQNRLKGKVDVNRMLRAVWRLAFAGAGIVYIVLFLISFFTYISAI
jgi:putative copper export protein